MCLFKKSEFKEYKKYNALVGTGVAIFFVEIILIVTVNISDTLLPRLALAQLVFSALAFILVLIALCFTANQLQISIEQYKKMAAKPKLSLAFSEDGKAEATIDISSNEERIAQLYIWIFNTGNAITKLFQIELEIPNIFRPNFDIPFYSELPSPTSRLSPSRKATIFSFCSNEKVYCFVNSPIKFYPIVLHSRPEDFEEYQNEYKLNYRVFGDWAETQEGELKVTINKQ